MLAMPYRSSKAYLESLGGLVIDGKTYGDVEEIAKAFEITVAAVYQRISRRTLHLLGVPRRAPVRIGDEIFPCRETAAAAKNVSVRVLDKALARGTIDNVGKMKAAGKRTGK